MEYLLVMSVSGSTMTTGCWVLRYLLKDRISAKLYYMLIKAAVLYYLIPLPFLKRWYGEALRAVAPERQMEIAQIQLTWTNYAVHADGRMYVNAFAGLQMVTVFGWLSVTCFLMARQLSGYLRTIRRIARYTDIKVTDRQKAFLAELKGYYRVKRHISLYYGAEGEPSITFGIRRPVIICGREEGSREAELLVRHEMVHIMRLDAFWKMLLQFVKFLHWWNPIMWLLYHEFDCICELSCDEAVMKGKTKEEVKEYLRLLIAEAQEEEKPKRASTRWKVGFGNNKRKIRERMDNLMRKKRWNKFAAGTLMAALIFANSMTVFAYRDTFHEIVPEDVSQEEIESKLNGDVYLFTPDGTEEEATQDFEVLDEIEIRYDMQFTDEEGNIYPIDEGETVEAYRGCNHDYVSGTSTIHTKTSDGGCVVRKYRSQRCSKCGTVVQGEEINVITYKVCPH